MRVGLGVIGGKTTTAACGLAVGLSGSRCGEICRRPSIEPGGWTDGSAVEFVLGVDSGLLRMGIPVE